MPFGSSPWSPPADCKCGHRCHAKRCGSAQAGCPCAEYEPVEEVTSPGIDSDYYTGAISRRMGG